MYRYVPLGLYVLDDNREFVYICRPKMLSQLKYNAEDTTHELRDTTHDT